MSDVKLSDEETALFHETGSRGDAFRSATKDRAEEQARTSRKMSEIVDGGGMVGAEFPEAAPPGKSMIGSDPGGADSAPAKPGIPWPAAEEPNAVDSRAGELDGDGLPLSAARARKPAGDDA